MKLITLGHDELDWDEGNTEKIKARVPLETIEVFFRQELLIKIDFRHSFGEYRFLAIGFTQERCLMVVFTIRQVGTTKLIRPISARYTHKKEREAYENEIKKLKENKQND